MPSVSSLTWIPDLNASTAFLYLSGFCISSLWLSYVFPGVFDNISLCVLYFACILCFCYYFVVLINISKITKSGLFLPVSN